MKLQLMPIPGNGQVLGIAKWRDKIIIACDDGVYVLSEDETWCKVQDRPVSDLTVNTEWLSIF